jgi:hypothetical protein
MDQPTPKLSAPSPVGASMEEYLTISEVAARLKISPKTLRNKMSAGVFRQGEHYVRPKGLGTRFKWGAVVAWLEQEDDAGTPEEDLIPMARGYFLGEAAK